MPVCPVQLNVSKVTLAMGEGKYRDTTSRQTVSAGARVLELMDSLRGELAKDKHFPRLIPDWADVEITLEGISISGFYGSELRVLVGQTEYFVDPSILAGKEDYYYVDGSAILIKNLPPTIRPFIDWRKCKVSFPEEGKTVVQITVINLPQIYHMTKFLEEVLHEVAVFFEFLMRNSKVLTAS